MRVLVTGGFGFIGSHLVNELVNENHEVTILDNFSLGNRNIGRTVRDKVKTLKRDISRAFRIGYFDIIFHLATQQLSLNENPFQKTKTFNTNVVGTYNLISELKKNNKKSPLFVFTSTANFYGSGRKFTEDSPFVNSLSIYGYTKAVAERIVELSGFPYVIFRPGTVIGPRGRCFPNRLVWCTINNTPVKIFNKGYTTRDIIDVRDVVSALLIADHLPYGIYNLGTNTETSGKELVSFVSKIAEEKGYKLQYNFIPNSPKNYILHSSLTTKLKGSGLWKPKHTLEDSLRTLFTYYKKGGFEPPGWENL